MVRESVNRRLDRPAEEAADHDYLSFSEALNSTARGRAFLEEFARRNRQADTDVVLAALNRIEAAAAGRAPDADRIRQDLQALLGTLRAARQQADDGPLAIKAATLSALIDFAEARIETLVTGAARDTETLTAVAALEQPELPIPHPLASTPAMALVPPRIEPAPHAASWAAKRKTAAIIPLVDFDYPLNASRGRVMPEELAAPLALPALSLPVAATPLPVADIAAPEKVEAVAVETYELWLDPPAVATGMAGSAANRALPDIALIETQAPEPTSAAATLIAEAPAPTSQMLDALMQPAQKTPAAVTIRADDPLAPILALSDDERLALFT